MLMAMEPDAEEWQPASKRQRRCLGRSTHAWEEGSGKPLGPRTAREAAHWAAQDVFALREQGVLRFQEDYFQILQVATQRGICLRTDYSGIGGAAEALSQVVTACEVAGGFRVTNAQIMVQRAGGLLAHCRWLLGQHTGRGRHPCWSHSQSVGARGARLGLSGKLRRLQGLPRAPRQRLC